MGFYLRGFYLVIKSPFIYLHQGGWYVLIRD